MLLNFLKEMPNVYLVFVCFLILIIGFYYTRDNNVFILANLALGGVIGVSRSRTSSQDVGTQNIDTQNVDKTINPNPNQ